MNEPTLADKVACLRRPATYPGDVGRVEVIETHMSWLFLTECLVYKLKKPIRYDRLDFSTLSLRRHFCEAEVRLNRRLAPQVYLGTVALTCHREGRLALSGPGAVVDWLVRMQRLPRDRMLDYLLAQRQVFAQDVRGAAQLLAEFFAHARPVPISAAALCRRLKAGVEADRQALTRPEYGLPCAQVETIAARQLEFIARHRDLFEARVRAGHIIEGHGDLRPEHICLLARPAVIDCLEFCPALREQDPADELAFLALECERLGQPRVGVWFIEAYERRTGDRLPRLLLDFYRKYRILRRAKIAVWHLQEPQMPARASYAERARHYLTLAGV